MLRAMTGLLAAFGAAMSGLAGIAHGVVAWTALSLAVMTAGSLAFLMFQSKKTGQHTSIGRMTCKVRLEPSVSRHAKRAAQGQTWAALRWP
jgi:hypothetical protein